MIIDKFKESINKRGTIKKGDSIIIGVSGGPDSVFMTNLLYTIKEEYDLRLYGVYLDHMTRNGESAKDAIFVESFLKELNIESYIFKKNITKMSQKLGISFEEAGRIERYEKFKEVLEKTNSNKIALGQNMNDQGETLLFRLFRGTGLDGLTGIDFVREDNVIRPIMDISRKEIEKYIEENNLEARIDETNLKPIYSRNKIRLNILPYIKENFNNNINETLFRTANILREDKELIDTFVNNYIKENVVFANNKYILKLNKFKEQLNAMQSRVIRQLVLQINDSLEGVTFLQIQEVLNLIKDGNTGKYKKINEIYFKINYDENLIYKELRTRKMKSEERKIKIKVIDDFDFEKNRNEKNKIYIDYNKVQGEIIVRTRQPGDRFKPVGMSGSKKLKDYFIDEKINSGLRNKIPIVCDEENIIWIAGYRMDRRYQSTKITKKAILIEYI